MVTGSNQSSANTGVEEYFDLSFAKEPASSYLLLLQLTKSHIKACWYHINKNLVTGFAKYALDQTRNQQDTLTKVLEHHPFLRSEFHQCVVSIDYGESVILPDAIAGSLDELDMKFQFNPTAESAPSFKRHDLVNINANIEFELPQWLDLWLKNQLSNPLPIPSAAPFIEWSFNHLKSSASHALSLLKVNEDSLDLFLFNNNQLCLSNRFPQSTPEDIAYYLLYSSEVVGIDPEKCPLIICGNVSLGDEAWKLIATYWKDMAMMESLKRIDISSEIPPAAQRSFADLTLSLLCAS